MRYILIIFLFFLSTNIIAKTNYPRDKYYSNWHLNRVYKKVLKSSDVNKKALKRAFAYYKEYKVKKRLSKEYLAIADYTKVFNSKRLYIIRLSDGKVFQYKLAHGKRSGARGGRVWRSSNKKNSLMTPYGFFKVGSKEGLTFKKRYSYLPIIGLEWKNRKVGLSPKDGGRDIVVHTANYVNYGGRSLGCFAIRPKDKKEVFKKLKSALLYSYTGK